MAMSTTRDKQLGLAGDAALAASAAPGMQTSELLRKRLQAKLGRVSGGTAPVGENLSETAAVGEAQKQALAQAQQGVQQATQAAVTEQAQNTQAAQTAQSDANKAEQTRRQYAKEVNVQLQELSQAKGKLDLDKDRAAADALGHKLRLNNDKYINRLQSEGAVRRLDDAAEFEKASLQSSLGFAEELFGERVASAMKSARSKSEFMQAMADLDMESWLRGIEYQAKTEGLSNMISGATTLVTAGAKAFDSAGTKTKVSTPGTLSNKQAVE